MTRFVASLLLSGSIILILALSASAGSFAAKANSDLQQTETCIRAALHKEELAIAYIREGKLSAATIAAKAIEPATTDLFICAAHALNAAAGLDQITPAEAKDVDADITDAAAADDAARHSLADQKVGQAISSLQEANRLKNEALTVLKTANARPPKPVVSTIFASFLPRKLATLYSISVISTGGAKPTYRWTLSLEQIDPDKSSPAGFQSSDPAAPNYASAGFDPSCNNVLLPNAVESSKTASEAVYVWSGLANEFTWYHGDKGSYPQSSYGCDHTKMGARGHQGIVSVKVTEGNWVCTASIDGTNLGLEPIHGDPAVCRYES